MSDGSSAKPATRPMFDVGDDETCEGRLTAAGDPGRRDDVADRNDVRPSQATTSVTAAAAAADGDEVTLKLSTPKLLDTTTPTATTTPALHKSASKYADWTVISADSRLSR